MRIKKLNRRGQGLIEYLIIVSLMAVAAMAILRVLSQTVEVKFAQITETLQGRKSQVQIRAEQIQQSHIKKKDMSDFFHGTKANKDARDE